MIVRIIEVIAYSNMFPSIKIFQVKVIYIAHFFGFPLLVPREV